MYLDANVRDTGLQGLTNIIGDPYYQPTLGRHRYIGISI